MTPEQAGLAYQALRRNDGNIMCTDWPADRRRELYLALDRLRSELMDRAKKGHSPIDNCGAIENRGLAPKKIPVIG